MGKRSITDKEIGLIKAMLDKKMKNKDIQFYFNRQDRAVNSGRISQIAGKTYGPEVSTASEGELSQFLSAFRSAEIGVVNIVDANQREPTLPEIAQNFFVKRGRKWFLSAHETDRTECKENFCLKPEGRFADPLRSIAGLANNVGGFIFFGVAELSDGSLQVVGMANDAFEKTDPAEINRCLAGALHPIPVFSVFILEFDDLKVGVIHVEKHNHPPVISIKNVNTEVKEGAIYFRYVGETRMIKPGELQNIISFREQKAIADFSRRMSRIAVGSAATLDLDTGKVEGRDGSFLISEDLLPKIQFLRHGDFTEKKGAPALRLIGDVATDNRVRRETIRVNVTGEAVLLNFLKSNPVAEPLQYILHSAHSARSWLPLFYYADSARIALEELVKILVAEKATYLQRRDVAAARLRGDGHSAYHAAAGKIQVLLTSTLLGELSPPLVFAQVAPISQAIQAIPNGSTVDFNWLKNILLAAYDLANGTTSPHKLARSHIYRAACRLDELEFSASVRGR